MENKNKVYVMKLIDSEGGVQRDRERLILQLSDYQRLNLFPQVCIIPAVLLHLRAAVDQLLDGALLPWRIIAVAHFNAVANTEAQLPK